MDLAAHFTIGENPLPRLLLVFATKREQNTRPPSKSRELQVLIQTATDFPFCQMHTKRFQRSFIPYAIKNWGAFPKGIKQYSLKLSPFTKWTHSFSLLQLIHGKV